MDKGISNMRSTKLKRKLLAGILCAAMVFQEYTNGSSGN